MQAEAVEEERLEGQTDEEAEQNITDDMHPCEEPEHENQEVNPEQDNAGDPVNPDPAVPPAPAEEIGHGHEHGEPNAEAVSCYGDWLIPPFHHYPDTYSHIYNIYHSHINRTYRDLYKNPV